MPPPRPKGHRHMDLGAGHQLDGGPHQHPCRGGPQRPPPGGRCSLPLNSLSVSSPQKICCNVSGAKCKRGRRPLPPRKLDATTSWKTFLRCRLPFTRTRWGASIGRALKVWHLLVFSAHVPLSVECSRESSRVFQVVFDFRNGLGLGLRGKECGPHNPTKSHIILHVFLGGKCHQKK